MLFVFLVYTPYIYHVFGQLKEYIWSLSLRTMESRREFPSFGLSLPLCSILTVSSHVHNMTSLKLKHDHVRFTIIAWLRYSHAQRERSSSCWRLDEAAILNSFYWVHLDKVIKPKTNQFTRLRLSLPGFIFKQGWSWCIGLII